MKIEPMMEPTPAEQKITTLEQFVSLTTPNTLTQPQLQDIVNLLELQRETIELALSKYDGKQTPWAVFVQLLWGSIPEITMNRIFAITQRQVS